MFNDELIIYDTYKQHKDCVQETLKIKSASFEFFKNEETIKVLYDWFLEALGLYRPQQIEFARLNLTYTVMSKRKLKKLVEGLPDPGN